MEYSDVLYGSSEGIATITINRPDRLNLRPAAIKHLKHAFNADSAHIFGQVKMAANGLAAFVNSEEAAEGRTAFLEKRKPDFSKFR